jgi:hypothetical protein
VVEMRDKDKGLLVMLHGYFVWGRVAHTRVVLLEIQHSIIIIFIFSLVIRKL